MNFFSGSRRDPIQDGTGREVLTVVDELGSVAVAIVHGERVVSWCLHRWRTMETEAGVGVPPLLAREAKKTAP